MIRSLAVGACALLIASTPAVAGPASGYPSATTPYAGTETVLGSEPGPGFTTATFQLSKVGIYALSLLSGDCVLNASNKIVCAQTNGSPFGTFATANAATPPAIGGTTPNSGAFTTLSASGQATFSSGLLMNGGIVSALTPNSGGTTGGYRLRGNATSGLGYFQITDSTGSIEWGNFRFSPNTGGSDTGPAAWTGGPFTFSNNLIVTGTLSVGGSGITSPANGYNGYTPAHSGANNDITSLSGLTTSLSVGQGGMGGASHTAHGVLLGEGASPVGATVALSAGQVMVGQGSTSDPVPQTIGGDATLAANGTLTVTASNGNTLTSAAWTPLGTSGSTICLLSSTCAYSGKQDFAASTASGAGVNIGQATTAPTSPVNGDLWATSNGVFVQVGGSTLQLGGSAFGVSSWTSPGGTVQTGAVTMHSADVTNALAYTPLNPASNLSDVANVATARSSLGLGTFATANAATPPGIGTTTPNSGAFTTLSATGAATAASFNGPLNGNATTATKLATPRSISTSGDISCSATNFDGSANITLPNCNLPSIDGSGGAVGGTNSIPVIGWDGKGRIISAGTAGVNLAALIAGSLSNPGQIVIPAAGNGTLYIQFGRYDCGSNQCWNNTNNVTQNFYNACPSGVFAAIATAYNPGQIASPRTPTIVSRSAGSITVRGDGSSDEGFDWIVLCN